ncbi:MAG: hypothetical protein CV089_03055 [Nitrospira sp. WS110]|nr:hypothetical protein [Nitrospira sp. WS110]
MKNRSNPVRRHSRFPVRWPMLYGSEELIAEGTVLDLTSLGWRLAGSMPVVPGMQLALQISVPERFTPLLIKRATVLWVKDHEFAIEAHEMASIDQAWVDEFLRQKLGLVWMSPTYSHENSVHSRGEVTDANSTQLQPPVPSFDDLKQQLSAFHTSSMDTSTNARCEGDSDFQQGTIHPSDDALPETIVFEARRIIRRILALKAARARTDQDPIANN